LDSRRQQRHQTGKTKTRVATEGGQFKAETGSLSSNQIKITQTDSSKDINTD